MVRLSNTLCLLGLVAASSQYDQEAQHRDADCDNGCFFKFFTNKCNDDNPACTCTLNDMRDNWFCCLAKNCLPHVLPDAVERVAVNCDAWKIPFGHTFDAEAVCGIKVASPSTSKPSVAELTETATSVPESKATTSTATAIATATGLSSATTISSTATTTSTSPAKSTSATPTVSSGNTTMTTSGAAVTTTSARAMASRTTMHAISAVVGLAAMVAAAL